MPIGAGGMRGLADEKQLLTELGKLFHTVKANYKERLNATRAAAAAAAKQQGRRAARKMRRRCRNVAGGSIWITLKGGFSTAAVPAAQNKKRVDAKCFLRGVVAEKKRLAALEAAEAFIESAWTAAQQAGIVERDGSGSGGKANCDEGVVYMREQFTTAVKMLDDAQTHSPGAFLRRCVTEAVNGGPGSAKGAGGASSSLACASPVDPKDVDAFKRKGGAGDASQQAPVLNWEDIAARELVIRQNPFTASLTGNSNQSSALADEAFRSTVSDAGNSYYYRLAEPASASSPADIAATKCIVRIRNSQRHKHTAILSSSKAVNYFKSNFMQVIRKELSASKLPRGAAAGDEAASASAAAPQQQQSKSAPQPQKQQQGGGKGKKRGKR